MNKKELEEAYKDWDNRLYAVKEIDSQVKNVYAYWKEKYNLVCKNYAKKVLGVGDCKFDKIVQEKGLTVEERKNPLLSGSFTTKLYNLEEIKKIKEEL